MNILDEWEQKDFIIRCIFLERLLKDIINQENSNRVRISVLLKIIENILLTEDDFEDCKKQILNVVSMWETA